jgi:hypothetical protein
MYTIKLVAAVSILGVATVPAFAETTATPASAPSSVAGAPSETQVNERRIFRLSKQWREKKVPLDKSTKDDELYWIRLKTVGNGMWEIESASHLSLEPRNNKEEVLLVSPRRKLYHPDWGVLKGEGNAPVSLVCTDKQVAATTPYWTCNSAFATLTTADAIVSFFVNTSANNASKELRSLYSFSENNLTKAVLQIDLDGAMRAAEIEGAKYQQRMAAQRESFRQSDLREKERSQLQRQADDVAKKQREDAFYVRVAKYPAGFRDVCQMPDAYTGVETTPPQDPKLVCQNMGEVTSLARLKNAGFIVTNTSKVRSAVEELGPYTRFEYTAWQYNVERFNLPK